MTPPRLAWSLAVAGFALVALPCRATPPAPAAASARLLSSEARAEARLRFDRGLALYETGDFTGALAEFQRAYELSDHPLVLYNLALVQAKLDHAAEAALAFEKLEARGLAEIGADRARHAHEVYEEQRLRIGTLELVCDVPNTTIQIDNVDLDPSRAGPARLTAGAHLVSLWAPGYAPRHLSVTVLGNSHKTLRVELAPLQEPSAALSIASKLVDVEVREAGETLARLPLAGELMLAPGRHELDFTREGYAPERRTVTLAPQGQAHLDVNLRPNPGASSALLALTLSEPDVIVSIDGEPSLAGARLRLPLGRHALLVRRAGFFDIAREVKLGPGTTELTLTLLPTPEHLADYVSRAKTLRLASYLTLGSGALVAAAGAGFLIWNAGEKKDAKNALHAFEDGVPKGKCPDTACDQTVATLLDDYEHKRHRDVYGWVAVGVGAAAVTTGAVLFALGNEPGRYDPKPASDVFGSLKLTLGARSLAVSGAF